MHFYFLCLDVFSSHVWTATGAQFFVDEKIFLAINYTQGFRVDSEFLFGYSFTVMTF